MKLSGQLLRRLPEQRGFGTDLLKETVALLHRCRELGDRNLLLAQIDVPGFELPLQPSDALTVVVGQAIWMIRRIIRAATEMHRSVCEPSVSASCRKRPSSEIRLELVDPSEMP